MRYANLQTYLRSPEARTAKGPLAMIFAEDPVEVGSTLRHHRGLGFRSLLLFASPALSLPDEPEVHRIDYDLTREAALEAAVEAVAAAMPGQWLYYCYNAEYLFYPFCETRSIGEMLAFHAEERRDAMLCYVIDLYAGDLGEAPNAVCLRHACLDRSGYYALARTDPANGHAPKERQLDFFGGLRWRFEEFIPAPKRKIDRIALFRARKGLHLRPDHTFDDEEYNTYSCPWHHNITAAVASFRTAKALKSNPGSASRIGSFRWRNSVEFGWNSQQLMELGLMEPGQWF